MAEAAAEKGGTSNMSKPSNLRPFVEMQTLAEQSGLALQHARMELQSPGGKAIQHKRGFIVFEVFGVFVVLLSFL